ncbi:MAG: MCP four helix bundle domain-containing protein, partial [Phycisphaerae bacterium]|nr:MCP four helix bundle domain-containing protein [Phycisphaerae bacterium]
MRHWSIGKKLVVGFASVLVVTAGLGAMAWWNGRKVQTNSANLANTTAPIAAHAGEVTANATEAVFEVRGFFLSGNEAQATDAEERLDEAAEHMQATAAVAEAYGLTDVASDANAAHEQAVAYRGYVTAVFQLYRDFWAKGEEMGKLGSTLSRTLAAYDADIQTTIEELAKSGTDQKQIRQRLEAVELVSKMAQELARVRVNTAFLVTKNDAERAANAQASLAKMADYVRASLDHAKSEADGRNLAEVGRAIAAYQAGVKEMLAINDAIKKNTAERTPLYTSLLATANRELSKSNEDLVATSEEMRQRASTGNLITTVGVVIAVVVGVALAWVIIRSLTSVLKRIAAGLGSGSEQVAAASSQIASSSQSLAEGASEQAASIEETTASIEEMTSMTKQNAGNSSEARTLAETAREDADNGVQAMQRMNGAIDDIKKSADETSRIIKTIDDIAFQ